MAVDSDRDRGALRRVGLLRWAAGLGAVEARALAVRDGIGLESARSRLAAAERAGVMRSWRLLADQPPLYTVTRAGLRACGRGELAAARLSAGGAAHGAACCRVAVMLEAAYSRHRVLGEADVRAAARSGLGRIPTPMLPAGGAGDARSHRPDLVLVAEQATGDLPIAVEVELTVKAPERLASICLAWARERTVGGVLYFAAEPALSPLARAVDRADAHGRVVVVPL